MQLLIMIQLIGLKTVKTHILDRLDISLQQFVKIIILHAETHPKDHLHLIGVMWLIIAQKWYTQMKTMLIEKVFLLHK